MPYPPQINKESIVAQAHQMIEAEGVAKLSLAKLAAALGVKAPSLYRHVPNKKALLRAVNQHTLELLFAVLEAKRSEHFPNPTDKMIAIMQVYHQFALANPHSYTLAFTTPQLRPDEDWLVKMVLPLQALMGDVVGGVGGVLEMPALRGALALVHGYAMLEINNQLQRGGDLSAQFTQAITAYLHGWQANQ
jgi:AcrR family transcriptional regulator